MIKKISIKQLKVGMYIHDLDCGWMDHPFMKNRFLITDPLVIQRIIQYKINHLYIDTSRGRDVADAPTAMEVSNSLQETMEAISSTNGATKKPGSILHTSATEERGRAQIAFTEANAQIRSVMEDVRLGRQVALESITPVTEEIAASVFRNPHALISISRIKTKDEYTFMHSVSVTALMIAFARSLKMGEKTIKEIAKGALLHDIGKIIVPIEILNKPGRLTDDEFDIMRSHVVKSGEQLMATTGITSTALDAVTMHHERIDGSGYPLGLKGDEISLIGQMSAIVDVYDALTSVRVYKDAWEPSFTLKKMLEWSPSHFSSELVQKFIRCLGIYPVGSLVELKSGLVGLVIEQHEDLLRPTLRIIYDSKKRHYTPIREIDLERSGSEQIARVVAPDEYQIDTTPFLL